jgi:choice-of-anchor A domain-containing protein/uncharacterized repeat protein (TIGR01451 family)
LQYNVSFCYTDIFRKHIKQRRIAFFTVALLSLCVKGKKNKTKGCIMKIMQKLMILILVKLLLTGSAIANTESTALVTSLGKDITVTLPAPYNETVYCGTFNGTINSNATQFYCIDITHELVWNDPYQDVSSTDSNLTYVLNNYYPAKAYPYTGSLSTVESEAGAVQLALWHFSDGLVIDNCTNVDASVKTRADAIVSDALTNAHAFTLNSFEIVIPPQSFNIGSPIQFTVQAFDDRGIAMPNVSVTLSTTGGTLSSTSVTTDNTGVTPTVTLTPSAGMTSATISATGTVGIPAGTKYYDVANPNGDQKLILATPTVAIRTISTQVTWYNQIILAVTKTADKTSGNNGDIINYTITVSNTGTSQAQNVVVSDQLPAILSFISSTPAGVFNPSTGTWSVGTLNAGSSASIVIKTQLNYSNSGANSFSLGTAADYNAFILDTLIQPSSDVQGKLAVGSSCDIHNYSVGDQLPANSGDVLVVGNHLTFISGRVYNGATVYQNYITSTTEFTSDGGIFQDSVINFSAAKLYLQNLSGQLASESMTDTAVYQYGGVVLNSSKTGLVVFDVDGSKLLNTNDISITVPANTTVLINVSGTNSKLYGGFEVNGTTKDKVIMNFYQAQTLTISNIGVNACILAPYADVTFPTGLVTGQFIVRKMTGTGQINLCPFTGFITRDTTVTNIATVAYANQNNMPCFYQANVSQANVKAGISQVNGINNNNNIKVESFNLEQNYPNPFNPSTKIRFSVAQSVNVKISVYNITGQLVAVLANGYFNNGSYEVTFNASNFASGIYLYQIQAGNYIQTKKMVLMK